jgi:hypothetical protein
MGTAATALRHRASRPADRTLVGLSVAGAFACVLATIALASGHVAGTGLIAVAAAGFVLLVAWCITHRRTDHTLAALGLYLGLLDGYVKLSTGSSTITLARDVIVTAIAAGALLRAMRSEERLALPPLGGFVVAFCIVVIVELANPELSGITAGLAGVRQHLEFVPLFFLGYAFVRRESQLQSLLLILVICAAAGGVISLVQSTLTPQQLAGWGPGYSERVLGTGAFAGAARVAFDAGGTSVRPFGLGSEAGSGAIAAALALPGLIALLMASRWRLRVALIPLSIGIGLAVATSGSRAAIVTVFVSVVAFGLIAAASKNGLRAVVGLALGGTVVVLAFQNLGTGNEAAKRAQTVAPTKAVSTFTTERGSSVLELGGLVSAHPLGVGVGTAGPAAGLRRATANASSREEGFNTETQWNFLVVEVGVAGLAIFVMFNFRLIAIAMTRIRRIGDRRLRLQLAGLAAPLVGLIAAGFAGPTTATVPSAPYLWLVAGILSWWLMKGDRPSEAMPVSTSGQSHAAKPSRV